MKIHEVFNEMSDDYTEKISRWVPYYSQMIGAIVEFLPQDFQPKQILDLGCGNGNISYLLAHKYPGASLHLVDASAEMLGVCKKRFTDHEKFIFEEAYFQELHFEEASFDLITAGLSLHHLNREEKQILFPKLYSWLSADGCFAFSDLLIEKEEEPYHSQQLQQWKSDAFNLGTTSDEWDFIMDHYEKFDHPNSFEYQQQWLINAGFKDVKTVWEKHNWICVLAQK